MNLLRKKRAILFAACAISLTLFSAQVRAQSCTTIQSGILVDSAGNVINVGYDKWGYNYQAHGYNGIYDNFARPAVPYTDDTCSSAPFGCTNLEMKWNDAWLSNKDCNGNLKLDRPTDSGSYKGSGAWITNHMSGHYQVTVNGKTKDANWTWFVKIVAVPADAVACGPNWCESDGTVIGAAIWGDFAIVQSVYNDPFDGFNGNEFKPVHPGLGFFKP